MITRYEEYIEKPKALTFEQMLSIHQQMIEEIGKDEEALELYDELLEATNRYSVFRAKWLLLDRQGRMDIDENRTAAHNSVITHCDMLQRYLKMQGKTGAWRDELGYEAVDPNNRRRIGDFASFLVFINSVNAR